MARQWTGPWKLLAAAHIVMAVAALLAAVFFLRFMLIPPALPLLSIAAWLALLAVWLWRHEARASVGVKVTHAIFLVFGAFQIVEGLFANEAAERSAAHGGGIMGGFGILLIGIGLALAVPGAVCLLLSTRLRTE